MELVNPLHESKRDGASARTMHACSSGLSLWSPALSLAQPRKDFLMVVASCSVYIYWQI